MTEKTAVDEKAGEDSASAAPASKRAAKTSGKKPASNKRPKKRAKKKPDGRGRPAWQPSIEDRVIVQQMKFAGESEAMIARALKVDVKTLRKTCAYELENGYANQRQKVISSLFDAMAKGNVSAAKALHELGKVSRAVSAMEERAANGKADPRPAPKEPQKGKKQMRKEAAQEVTGIYAPPEPPTGKLHS